VVALRPDEASRAAVVTSLSAFAEFLATLAQG